MLKSISFIKPSRSFAAIQDQQMSQCNQLTNEDSHSIIQRVLCYLLQRRKGIRRKPDTDTTTKQSHPQSHKEKKEKKYGKGKQKAKELETISEAVMTEAEQLKTITKRSRKETHNSYASGSGADEGTGVSPGVPDAPDYDSDDVISWKSSEDDQADDKNDDDENAQNDANDDKNDDDENVQEDDDKAQTESEDDGDDFIHPKLTTHDDETTHEEETDDEDSANEIEGVDVEGEKSDEDATDEEDQGNETNKDTNANLERRNDVMSDVILPQASSSNMLNPNQIQYDRIREESHTENQQFLDLIDEGMKKVIKEQVKKEVSKITPKIEKLVNKQLESEVLVRSSKEAKTSHAVAANLSELELKKILIDKMEANNSINRSDIQRQLYKALVEAYEADKILLDTYGDTVTIKSLAKDT
ncbi:hypothetical protein Tco_1359473 [Tanacetum coccineum]